MGVNQDAWQKAYKAGDTAGMNAAHQAEVNANAGSSKSFNSSTGTWSGGNTSGKTSGGGGTSHPTAKSTVNPNTGVDNNNYFSGGGYAYNDKYGLSHVVSDYQTALDYSGDGNIQNYDGAFGGGYALNNTGDRIGIQIGGTKAYGNDKDSNGNRISLPLIENSPYLQAISRKN